MAALLTRQSSMYAASKGCTHISQAPTKICGKNVPTGRRTLAVTSAAWSDVRQQFQGLKKKTSSSDATPKPETSGKKPKQQPKAKASPDKRNSTQVDKLLTKQSKSTVTSDKSKKTNNSGNSSASSSSSKPRSSSPRSSKQDRDTIDDDEFDSMISSISPTASSASSPASKPRGFGSISTSSSSLSDDDDINDDHHQPDDAASTEADAAVLRMQQQAQEGFAKLAARSGSRGFGSPSGPRGFGTLSITEAASLAASSSAIKVFRYAVEAARVQRAIQDAGLQQRVVQVEDLKQADAVISVKLTPGGKHINLKQAQQTASNAGIPLIVVGRSMTGNNLSRALQPVMSAKSSSDSKQQ